MANLLHTGTIGLLAPSPVMGASIVALTESRSRLEARRIMSDHEELIKTLALEAALRGDYWSLDFDEFGVCPSQSSVLSFEVWS